MLASLFASAVGLVLTVAVVGVLAVVALILIPTAIAMGVVVGAVVVLGVLFAVIRAKVRRALGIGTPRDERENVRVRRAGEARDVMDAEVREGSQSGS